MALCKDVAGVSPPCPPATVTMSPSGQGMLAFCPGFQSERELNNGATSLGRFGMGLGKESNKNKDLTQDYELFPVWAYRIR